MSQEIFILEDGFDYIDFQGMNDKDKAIEFLNTIGNKSFIYKGTNLPYTEVEKTDLEVGAFKGGYVISNFDIAWEAIFVSKFMHSILRAFPKSNILALVYYDTCLVSGYGYFENGELVRSAIDVDGDDPAQEKGVLLEEEKKSVLNSAVSSTNDCEEEEDFREIEIDGKNYSICRRMLLENRGNELLPRVVRSKDLYEYNEYTLGEMTCFQKKSLLKRIFG